MRTSFTLPSARLAGRGKQLAGVAVASALLLGTSAQWAPAAGAATPAPSSTSTASSSPSPSPTASSSPAATPVVMLTGSLGTLPASTAVITVRAQIPESAAAVGSTMNMDAAVLGTETITSPVFSVPVPDSATLQQAESKGHGIVNFLIEVMSGTSETMEFVPATLTAAPVSATASGTSPLGSPSPSPSSASAPATPAQQVQVPAFPPFRAMAAAASQAASASCGSGFNPDGPEYQETTIIGEDHVANTPGVTDTFEFSTENDETVGVAWDESGQLSASGSVTLTNSLSTTGYHTFTQGQVAYVGDDTIYQEYAGCLWFAGDYYTEAVGSEDDVFNDGGSPGTNPWGGCENDPLHVTLQGGSGWNSDKSTAHTYSGGVSILGVGVNTSDGFTQDVEHDYVSAEGSKTTYICAEDANVQPSAAGILYSTYP